MELLYAIVVIVPLHLSVSHPPREGLGLSGTFPIIFFYHNLFFVISRRVRYASVLRPDCPGME